MEGKEEAMTSRRYFLRRSALYAVGVGVASPLLSWKRAFAQSPSIEIPGEDGLIVRSFRFLDLETPVEYFNSWLTPTPHFFVRNHMHEPIDLDASSWRLSIGGEVEKGITLTLSELSKFPSHSIVNTLECAGNGRGMFRPQVPGIQW